MCSLFVRFSVAHDASLSLIQTNRIRVITALFIASFLLIIALFPAQTSQAQSPYAQNAELVTGNGNIIGGEAAESGAYPWMVGIIESDREDPFWAQYCGGTLIHAQWVLTAAHCTYESGQQVETDEIEVLIGRETLRGTTGERVKVQQIIRHPSYKTSNGDADIALIKLAKPSDIPPITMADRSMIDIDKSGAVGTILGWGRTTTNIRINDLQQAQVPLVGAETCAAAYQVLGYKLTVNMLCAGYQAGGTDACSGDSGGPLIIRSDQADERSEWIQVGVISWGKGCAQPNAYGVYAHVAQFKDWVDVQIALDTIVSNSGSTTLPPPAGQSVGIAQLFMPFIGN